ncbi:MAG: TetR/AcrR family transcriptional regulator [Gammaproteobacteria bacterium]|nr:TetR/AcrR family transcriptional regulator [Gammaproteobacteria bacterium]
MTSVGFEDEAPARRTPAQGSRRSRLTPRRPQQARSRARFNRILDVAEAVFIEVGLDALSCHRVAQRAGVPPASVYQYFPSKYALLVGLADRHLAVFDSLLADHFAGRRFRRWESIVNHAIDLAVRLHNEDDAFRLLTIGDQGSRAIRVLDKQLNRRIAAFMGEQIARHCAIVDRDGALGRALEVTVEIFDAVAGAGAREQGCIDAWHAREARRAATSYLGSFLHEYTTVAG